MIVYIRFNVLLCAGMQERISIILPCYNEGEKIYENISLLHAYISEKLPLITFELVLVNDGSQDNTKHELFRLKNKFSNANTISYNINKGKGYALKRGLSKAKGDIIAFYDSDLDIAPGYLIEHIGFLLDNKKNAIVIGRKKIAESTISIKRKLISNINIQVNSVLFGLPVRDTQTGLKVFRKELKEVFLKNVKTYGYAYDVDFLYHTVMNGHVIESLPVTVEISEQNSGVNTRTILIFLRDLFTIYKKNHSGFLLRKGLTLKTKCKIALLKFVIFPIEKSLNFVLFCNKLITTRKQKYIA